MKTPMSINLIKESDSTNNQIEALCFKFCFKYHFIGSIKYRALLRKQ